MRNKIVDHKLGKDPSRATPRLDIRPRKRLARLRDAGTLSLCTARRAGVKRLSVAFLFLTLFAMDLLALEVKSPDGQLTLQFDLKNAEGGLASPIYQVSWRGKVIIAPSRLGFELDTNQFMSGFELAGQTQRSVDIT